MTDCVTKLASCCVIGSAWAVGPQLKIRLNEARRKDALVQSALKNRFFTMNFGKTRV